MAGFTTDYNILRTVVIASSSATHLPVIQKASHLMKNKQISKKAKKDICTFTPFSAAGTAALNKIMSPLDMSYAEKRSHIQTG